MSARRITPAGHHLACDCGPSAVLDIRSVATALGTSGSRHYERYPNHYVSGGGAHNLRYAEAASGALGTTMEWRCIGSSRTTSTAQQNLERLLDALQLANIEHTVVPIPRGSSTIEPAIDPDGRVFACGALKMAAVARAKGWDPGRILNDNFHFRAWHEHLGEQLLNHSARAVSNRIVGWAIDERMKARLVVAAVEMAVARRGNPDGCILDSDRGSQFRARKVARCLARHRVVGSMGQVGTAADNAGMGSFFALLERNVLDARRWTTRDQLRIAIVIWIERTSHRRRRQAALGRLTPTEYETITAPQIALAA